MHASSSPVIFNGVVPLLSHLHGGFWQRLNAEYQDASMSRLQTPELPQYMEQTSTEHWSLALLNMLYQWVVCWKVACKSMSHLSFISTSLEFLKHSSLEVFQSLTNYRELVYPYSTWTQRLWATTIELNGFWDSHYEFSTVFWIIFLCGKLVWPNTCIC